MLPTAVKFKMIFLKSSKVGGISHPTLPSLSGCRSVMLISPIPISPLLLSPDSLWTSQRDHHGKDLTANGAPASTEIWHCFVFLKRWNTWRIREITSPYQQTSDYSIAQAAIEATVIPRCLALPKVMGQNILSALFLYFVWLDCPCRHCSSERKFSERQTEIFMAGHTFNSHL